MQVRPSTALAIFQSLFFLLSALPRLPFIRNLAFSSPDRNASRLSASETQSNSIYGLLPLSDTSHEYLIAAVNLAVVVLMVRYDTRGLGALAGVFQVGNGAYAKWKSGRGVTTQVVLAGFGVAVWGLWWEGL